MNRVDTFFMISSIHLFSIACQRNCTFRVEEIFYFLLFTKFPLCRGVSVCENQGVIYLESAGCFLNLVFITSFFFLLILLLFFGLKKK